MTQEPMQIRSPKLQTLVGIKLTTQLLSRMQIPEVHWHALLKDIPDTCKHKSVIIQYIDHIVANIRQARGLLLFGEYSMGKSALGAILLKAAAYNGHIGLWVKAERVPEIQIEGVPFDEEMNLYERALSVPILVLDELKLRTEAKGVEQYCEMLIRRRIDDKKCTIITTNHAPSVIKEKYPALYAPLIESVVPVKIEGHDFRRAIAEGNR